VFKELEKAKIVRWNILDTGKRIDGRDPRPSVRSSRKSACCRAPTARRCSPAARRRRWSSPRSAPARTSSIIDSLEGTYKEHFMLHYNFPPYSVGETGRMGSPGPPRNRPRQARLARHPSDPAGDDFPYTIRVVSEITESNGSSSMATVCGTVAGADGCGRAAEAPVAGIAMGLIKEGEPLRRPLRHPRRRGSPRRHGLQGGRHRNGVTSLQMDIKITGITEEIMKVALTQAKDGRLHILGEMAKALTRARRARRHAPRIE
jgi:polyribonucleotide nucleotidyltransferase